MNIRGTAAGFVDKYVSRGEKALSNYEKQKNTLIEHLLHVDSFKAEKLFDDMLRTHVPFEEMENLITEALDEIGNAWADCSVSLAQVYMSAVICADLLDRVKEIVPVRNSERQAMPRIAIGVLLDQHKLGKSMVMTILRANGYEVCDFGHGLTPEELACLAVENRTDILLISTLIYPSALKITRVRELLNQTGHPIKIVAGGAPFRLDSRLWEKVGADADGKMASDIVSVIERMVEHEAH